MVCGQKPISWQAFASIIPGLLKIQLSYSNALEPGNRLHHTEMINLLKAMFLKETPPETTYKNELLTLLSMCRECEATDPRDKVFALLGLCSDTQREILPNLEYSQTPEYVFWAVTKAMQQVSVSQALKDEYIFTTVMSIQHCPTVDTEHKEVSRQPLLATRPIRHRITMSSFANIKCSSDHLQPRLRCRY